MYISDVTYDGPSTLPYGGYLYLKNVQLRNDEKDHFCDCLKRFGMVYGVSCRFQQYISYIMAVSFIGGGNQSTRRKSRLKRI